MPVEGSIYACTRDAIAKRFAAHFEGPRSALFLVVAEKNIEKAAREALDKSARALGWDEGASFVWVQNGEGGRLSQAELFEVIEGLDPLCVVLVGKDARELATASFQCDIPTLGHFRLFGREACAFDNFESLLASETGKQTAWALLRALPKAPTQ